MSASVALERPVTSAGFVPVLLGVIAASAALPLYWTPFGHVTLRSTDLLVALACAAEAIALVRRRALPFTPGRVDLTFVALVALVVLSVGVAQDHVLWLKGAKPWLLALALYGLVRAHAHDAADVRRLLRLLVVGLGAQAVVGLAQVLAGRDLVRAALEGPFGTLFYERDVVDWRLPDFFFNWNVGPADGLASLGVTVYPSGTNLNGANFVVILAVLAALAAFGALGPGRWQTAGLALGGLALALVSVAFKRSGTMALVAMLPAILVLRPWRSLAILAAPAAATWLVIATVLVVNHLPLYADVPDDAPAAATQANHRLALWKHATGIALEHPLTGIGTGQWELHGPLTETRRGTIRWGNPESAIFGLFAELGFPGLLVFAAFALQVMLVAWKTLRRADEFERRLAASAGSALAALLAGSCFNDLLMDDKVWPLVAVLAASVLVVSRARPYPALARARS